VRVPEKSSILENPSGIESAIPQTTNSFRRRCRRPRPIGRLSEAGLLSLIPPVVRRLRGPPPAIVSKNSIPLVEIFRSPSARIQVSKKNTFSVLGQWASDYEILSQPGHSPRRFMRHPWEPRPYRCPAHLSVGNCGNDSLPKEISDVNPEKSEHRRTSDLPKFDLNSPIASRCVELRILNAWARHPPPSSRAWRFLATRVTDAGLASQCVKMQ
jgi:hypothetical protein